MNTDKHRHLSSGGDGEFSNALRAAVDEICREEPEETAVERVVVRALRIPDANSPSRLNLQRAGIHTRRRMLVRRIVIPAAAAAVLAGVWLGTLNFTASVPGANAFALTVAQVQKAKTITWKSVFYEHITSKDGKRTWAHSGVIECAYRAPGLYREVRLDDQGKIEDVEIKDWIHGRKLAYSLKTKKATLSEIAPSLGGSGPFAYALDKLNSPNLQWVGKRTTAAGEANVFRHTFRWYVDGERDWSVDFWIDAKTKQLVACYQPGADVYDFEHDPARNTRPGKASGRRMMGGGKEDIRYDVTLDDSLFRLEPPTGYAVEVKPRDHITEKEMIDYLGILADFNDKTFPDQAFPTPDNLMSKLNRALKRPRNDLTAAERKLLDTDMRYGWRFGTCTNAPILVFFAWDPDATVEKSFRYLGKGVKLGEKDRIVCWYKLKGAKDPKAYRVVYGDLSVKDVEPENLPLPVEP
jgi:hypothetical protein